MTDDSDLRARFDSLKADDALSAGAFSAYWQAARQQAGRRDRRTFNVQAIAAALVVGVIAAFAVHIHSFRTVPIEQIGQWRSPTALLLRTPGSQLLTTMPRFGDSVIPSFKESELK